MTNVADVSNVAKIIDLAVINTAVLGMKAFCEAKAAAQAKGEKLHHRSAEALAVMPTKEQRTAEAIKFAPFIKVDGQADKSPAVTKGEIVDWFKSQNLSLNMTDFSAMLEGTRAQAAERETGNKPAPKASTGVDEQKRAENTRNVFIPKAQHEFFMVLLELVKRDAPAILNAAYSEIQLKRLEEAQERIKAELAKEMGGLAELLPQPQEEAPVWTYDDEIITKAKAVLENADKGQKVPAKTINAAKLVLAGAATDDAQLALLG
ncbi:TPA: hypothetical protein ACV5RJ_004334 [Enterobacter roggenkampii]